MKKSQPILFLIISTIIILTLQNGAYSETDKIKKYIWNHLDEGARVYLRSSWQKSEISQPDETFDMNNPNYFFDSGYNFEKLLSENKIYITKFKGSSPYHPGYEVTVFSDEIGNIVGYDNTYRRSIPVTQPK
ncbi:MAG: hypothetical protein QMB63_07525 [Clostridiaceae bacterium]